MVSFVALDGRSWIPPGLHFRYMRLSLLKVPAFSGYLIWVVAFVGVSVSFWIAFVQLKNLVFLTCAYNSAESAYCRRPKAPASFYLVAALVFRNFFAYQLCKRTPAGQSRTNCFPSRAIEVAMLAVRRWTSGTNLRMFHSPYQSQTEPLSRSSIRAQSRKAICASARLTSATSRGETSIIVPAANEVNLDLNLFSSAGGLLVLRNLVKLQRVPIWQGRLLCGRAEIRARAVPLRQLQKNSLGDLQRLWRRLTIR